MPFSVRQVGTQFALVGLAGGLGAVGRYALIGWLGGVDDGMLPWGTLAANLAGSFLLGMVAGFVDRDLLGNGTRLFLAVGLLGGFTTFSQFSYESLELLRDERMLALIANVSVQTGGGVGADALGYLIASRGDAGQEK